MSAFRLNPDAPRPARVRPVHRHASPARRKPRRCDGLGHDRLEPIHPAAMERDMSAALARAETDIARIADTPDKELSYERVIAAYSAATRAVWATRGRRTKTWPWRAPAGRAQRGAAAPRVLHRGHDERTPLANSSRPTPPRPGGLASRTAQRHLDPGSALVPDSGAELDAAGKARLYSPWRTGFSSSPAFPATQTTTRGRCISRTSAVWRAFPKACARAHCRRQRRAISRPTRSPPG